MVLCKLESFPLSAVGCDCQVSLSQVAQARVATC